VPHPLEGCRLKLARAGVHLTELKEAVDQVVGPEPDRIPGELDPTGGQYLFRAQRDRQVPLVLSVIVGDVVHNLFTALDYLAWELAVAHRGRGDTSTAFPIFDCQKQYEAHAPGKLRHIHPSAQAQIEREQPFRVSPRDLHPSEHPLTWLYALEIRDKHRTLNLTDISASARLQGLPPHIYTPPGYSGFRRGSYQRGEVLASLTGFSSEPPLHVTLEVLHEVAFEESGPAGGEEVLRALGRIAQHVQGVVDRFQRFF
jgi:hypothetical protein